MYGLPSVAAEDATRHHAKKKFNAQHETMSSTSADALIS
jgi:hypothetical protein